MRQDVIKCPRCGFEAVATSIAGRGNMKINPLEMAERCAYPDKAMTFSCPVFDEEFQRPRRAR